MLTVGSLFAGIGGFDLGLERAGMRSVWQCEIDPYCQRVLAKHWPDVLRVPDIRDVGAGTVPYVDVICGGFPCQDISDAGNKVGIDGARSGLWSEYARVIGELRPRYVVVENVAALLSRGLGRVLGDLAACGYDAEWDCIPASALGAPHQRDRLWLVAYSNGSERCAGTGQQWPRGWSEPRNGSEVGDAHPRNGRASGADQDQGRPAGLPVGTGQPGVGAGEHWRVEPAVGRVADGVPARVDRLRALGNALVPQIAEWIGRRIVDHEAQEGRLAA